MEAYLALLLKSLMRIELDPGQVGAEVGPKVEDSEEQDNRVTVSK